MILRAIAKLIVQNVANHRILGVETPRKTTSVPSTDDTAIQNVTNVDLRTFTDISPLPFLNRTNTPGLSAADLCLCHVSTSRFSQEVSRHRVGPALAVAAVGVAGVSQSVPQ